MVKQKLLKKILSSLVVVMCLVNSIYIPITIAQDSNDLNSFECVFKGECGDDLSQNNSQEVKYTANSDFFAYNNSQPVSSYSDNCSSQGKGTIIGGERDGQCGSGQCGFNDNGNPKNSYHKGNEKYSCTPPNDQSNNQPNNTSTPSQDRDSDVYDTSDCSNSKLVIRIEVSKSERKLRTFGCKGYLNAYNVGIGKGEGAWLETPSVSTTVYKSEVLYCGGSCEGQTPSSAIGGNSSEYECDVFRGNGVRGAVIPFYVDGSGCFFIHGYFNINDSHGCVRMYEDEVNKIANNLAESFTVDIS